MMDNTKKRKEFNEALAFEKFSNNNAYIIILSILKEYGIYIHI